MKKLKLVFALVVVCLASIALADEIPIEDLSGDTNQSQASSELTTNSNTYSPPQPPLTLEQRVAKIEQQMANLNQMDVTGNINDIQEQLQKLKGDLETQQHQIDQLSQQLKDYYKDLDQRISTQTGQGGTLVTGAEAATPAVVPTTTAADPKAEQAAYQAGLDAIKNKKYDAAISAFQKYVQSYPNGKFVANAHYWSGEIYYLQTKTANASKEFQLVITKFPTSEKAPDAMLKIAMIYSDQGQYDKAAKEFQLLKKQYPTSSAAQTVDKQITKTDTTTTKKDKPKTTDSEDGEQF